jgi:hypothetical protein
MNFTRDPATGRRSSQLRFLEFPKTLQAMASVQL